MNTTGQPRPGAREPGAREPEAREPETHRPSTEAGNPWDDDHTVVRPREVSEVPAYEDDHTVARAVPSPIVPDDDQTVVRARHREPKVAPDPDLTASRGTDRRGDPVPEPAAPADSVAEAAAPLARAEKLRRAGGLMPRVYGPRQVATPQDSGPAVAVAGGIGAARSRSTLPSIARRDRRARVATLVGYAAAIALAGTGLWFIATLAFAS